MKLSQVLNINTILPQSSIYGLGERFVIWTQGCSIHCKGCWNQDTWSFKPKSLWRVEDLLKEILQHKESIEGVTILGGEPLDQYEAVLHLVQKLKQEQMTIMLYTGYEYQEIFEKRFYPILDFVDILIPGRYVQEERDIALRWRGSKNQKVLFLSEHYKNYPFQEQNGVEIFIQEDGSLSIFGYPDDKLLSKI